MGHFENVAALAGLLLEAPTSRAEALFDDFNGDGLPDLFTTSLDADLGASLFINRGDGTFDDRSASAGLGDQVYALNVTRADFNNDGNLDVLLLRGGWETPERLSLLKNQGNGAFEDVTLAAGLGDPIATESAAWETTTATALSTCLSVANTFRPALRSRRLRQAGAIPATIADSITTKVTASSVMSPRTRA